MGRDGMGREEKGWNGKLKEIDGKLKERDGLEWEIEGRIWEGEGREGASVHLKALQHGKLRRQPLQLIG